MPNYCDYKMRIIGRTENVKELIKILQCTDYLNIHFYRIFEASDYDYEKYGLLTSARVDGYCAWSVFCCMLPGAFSYYDETRLPDGVYANEKDKKQIESGSNLLIETKRLNLTVEIWSFESGMCFSEHIIVSNGIMIRNKCLDFYDIYIDEYNTYNDMLEEYKSWGGPPPIISEQQFNDAKDARQESIPIYEEEPHDTINFPPKYMYNKVMYEKVDKKQEEI